MSPSSAILSGTAENGWPEEEDIVQPSFKPLTRVTPRTSPKIDNRQAKDDGNDEIEVLPSPLQAPAQRRQDVPISSQQQARVLVRERATDIMDRPQRWPQLTQQLDNDNEDANSSNMRERSIIRTKRRHDIGEDAGMSCPNPNIENLMDMRSGKANRWRTRPGWVQMQDYDDHKRHESVAAAYPAFRRQREENWNDLDAPLYKSENEAATRHGYDFHDEQESKARSRKTILARENHRSIEALGRQGARMPEHRFSIDLDLDDDKENDAAFAQKKIPDGVEIIDIEELEETFEEEAEQEIQNSPKRKDLPRLGCAPLQPPWVSLDTYKPGLFSEAYEPGKCVQLHNGSFLHIAMIAQNLQTDQVVLRGLKLVRTRELNGLLPKKLNELCYVLEHVLDDPRTVVEQNIIEVELEEVVGVRAVTFTNYLFPAFRFKREEAMVSQYKHICIPHVETFLELVVRWKLTTSYNDPGERGRAPIYPTNIRQRRLESLTEVECTEDCFMPADTLRQIYRPKQENNVQRVYDSDDDFQEIDRFGKKIRTIPRDRAKKRDRANKDQTNKKDQATFNVPSDVEYSFGDAFCGAGGTTAGARLAGLKVKYGVDNGKYAGMTWRANFPDANHYEMTIHDMIARNFPPEWYRVTVLHLSPPCQFWSPIHVHEGKNDEMNIAALFACGELLKKAKPRFATLEQTFGILHPKFTEYFNALIQMFTANSYTISWQILEFQRYGLAQSRRRCIIVAAAPGETLPNIPEYTHSDTPNFGVLLPYTSAQSILNSIPRNAANHDVHGALAANNAGKFKAFDASGIIPCITCDGGQHGHPSGKRGFTHREIAALQSYPHTHVFMGNEIKKQIGNAFASMIAQKVLFEPILRQLKKTDGGTAEVVVLED